MKKVIIGFVALVAILGVAAGAAYLYLDKDTGDKQADAVAAAQDATKFAAKISEVLSKETPVSWVYDADDELMFAVRVSDETSATKVLPSYFEEKLRAKCGSNIYSYAFNKWLSENGRGAVSDRYMTTALSLLETEVSETDLLRYLSTDVMYGGVRGLENAAITYFNREATKLSSYQYDFLLYCFGASSVDTVEYLAATGLSADQLAFKRTDISYMALETMLREELLNIPDVKVGLHSYMIKLSLSAAHQQSLQSCVDNVMKSYIGLAADGSYVVNTSVALMDNKTGFVTAYVPGRTVSTDYDEEFSMNIGLWFDNFDKLVALVAPSGSTKFTLQEIVSTNGERSYSSADELWDKQTLANGVAKNKTAIDVLQKIKVMMMSSSTSMIQQVKKTDGTLVYKADAPVFQPSNNVTVLKLRSCFADDFAETTNVIGSALSMSTGVVGFEMTNNYTIVVLVGSGAVGSVLSNENRNNAASTVTAIMDTARTFFAEPTSPIYVETEGVKNELAATYEHNYNMLMEDLERKFEELAAIEVVSTDTRKAFESAYEKLSLELTKLAKYISAERFNELGIRLYTIRQERAAAILKYSV